MPNPITWRCEGCRLALGTAIGPTLALATVEGLRVLATLATLRGAVATCAPVRPGDRGR